MFKYIIVVLIINTILLIGDLTNQDVSLIIMAPAQAEAGTTVDVEIELYKGDLTGFARFQQELPYGVTASPVYPADMNFAFEDNALKMIWLNLPEDDIITIRYQIHINERLKGELQLGGTFSYIENNQRMSAETSGTMLAVNPSPRVEDRFIVDISEANEKLLSPAPSADPAGNIVAIRQDPVPDNDLGYIVHILVNKEERNHFAKIEEYIPEGYTATEIESQGGIFSFSDQKARIIWRNLPQESNFIVSYRLLPDNDAYGEPELSGDFSFMHNEITSSRRIIQKDADLTALSENEISQMITSLPRQALIATTVTSPVVRPSLAEKPSAIDPSTADRPVIRAGIPVNNPLEAESGVYYRVQIAAGHRPVDVDRYFGRLNVSDDVRTEIHEGWIKYSIGSHYDYRSARDYRIHIWNTTPIDDAFVSAYNDGLRITVQEALMIANHQWYR